MSEFVVYDVEVYPNYFGAGFMELGGEFAQFSTLKGNLADLPAYIAGKTLIGFNNHAYDDFILAAMLAGMSCSEVYALSVERISSEDRTRSPIPDTIDLRTILGGDRVGSLKELGIKLDHPVLRELPYRFDTNLTPIEQQEVEDYNVNDLSVTLALTNSMADAISARYALTDTYTDVITRRDSGIAETILSYLMYDGVRPPRPTQKAWSVSGASLIHPGVEFQSAELQEAHATMRAWQIDAEAINNPEAKKTELNVTKPAPLEIRYGDNAYSLGLGGIHTRDTPGVFHADDDHTLLDIDVESYYPNLILGMELVPRHLPNSLLEHLRGIVQARVTEKATNKGSALDTGLKIAINSVFGKFGSPYSWLFDPTLGWTVTINGQLILLMLVERLTPVAEVLSANTDGVLVRVRRDRMDELRAVVGSIQDLFKLRFSYTDYALFARRDINNYVAVEVGGKLKGKGAYTYDKANLMKKSTERIVVDAVKDHFLTGTPVRQTIVACRDVREFIEYFKCSGGYGIEQGGVEVGKIARWVRVRDGEPINKVKVADQTRTILANGRPVLLLADLPDSLDGIDLDLDYYVEAAQSLIDGIEHPGITVGTTLALGDMTKEQAVVFARNYDDLTVDPVRLAAIDVDGLRTAYASAGKGQYDCMKRLLRRAWCSGQGRLTRGDLVEVARQIEAGTGYFEPADKARGLVSMVEWFARSVCPIPRPRTVTEIATAALLWAERTIQVSDKPMMIAGVHRLVIKSARTDFVKTGDVNKLAVRMAARARQNGFDLSVEAMVRELDEQVAARNGDARVAGNENTEIPFLTEGFPVPKDNSPDSLYSNNVNMDVACPNVVTELHETPSLLFSHTWKPRNNWAARLEDRRI